MKKMYVKQSYSSHEENTTQKSLLDKKRDQRQERLVKQFSSSKI